MDVFDGEIFISMILFIVGLNMLVMGLLMLLFSLYIGILFIFGCLYVESEIIVMNVIGIGNKFLICVVLYLVLIMVFVVVFNVLWFVFWS